MKKKETAKERRRYVLPKGKGINPGVYKTYDGALANKFPGDCRPYIRVFPNEEEANYFFKYGVEMPRPAYIPETKGKELFTEEENKKAIEENKRSNEDFYAGL